MRRVQDFIAEIETEGHMVISGGEGYELASAERGNLDKYEHSILTLYAHSDSEREAADRKFAMLQKERGRIKQASRFTIQERLEI